MNQDTPDFQDQDSSMGKDWIFDWNIDEDNPPSLLDVEFDDETLRDGLQSASVTDPDIEEKRKILQLMVDLGIQSANIGLPGASAKFKNDALILAKDIVERRLPIYPNCAARTIEADIEPVIEISQKAGLEIEAATFIGSSPIRQFAEGWILNDLLKLSEDAIHFSIKNGCPVMYVTEDTTRSRPEVIRKLYTAAIECGAKRICVCDTVGHIVPSAVKRLIRFVKGVVAETGEDVKVDWHGHRDRHMSVLNSIAAAEAGVDRIHGTALGIGERVGNTPMDVLLTNMKLMGYIDLDLRKLKEYCHAVSIYCNVRIDDGAPLVGKNAFRTATGVHAAAIIKAGKKGSAWLADRIYSGIPAGDFGFEQIIDIGPMSGKSNVIFWLEKRGVEPTEKLVERIFDRAKRSHKVLSDAEIYVVIEETS